MSQKPSNKELLFQHLYDAYNRLQEEAEQSGSLYIRKRARFCSLLTLVLKEAETETYYTNLHQNLRAKEPPRAYLFKLLFYGFLEIREEAVMQGYNTIFTIADTFHKIPILLEKCQTEDDYEQLLTRIQ